ncbi:MAG: GNAT family N-acetyltransferase [Cyclobacteriaceae bacterium]|nr:GNAT family N-acetyltransferase [Cyclobacteriaceae bacterium]
MEIIRTKRLSIFELKPENDSDIYKLMNSPTWIQFIGDRNIKTVEDAREYLLNGPIKSYQEHGIGMYGLRIISSNEFAGICGFVKRHFLNDFDLGYALLPEFEGKGLAFEGSKAVLDFVKKKNMCPKIVAFTTQENKRSLKLLEKLGFLYTKTFMLENEECLLFESQL